MARIALLSWGSHGDILPFVALAQRLKASGHEVLLAAQPQHADFVLQQNCPFHALGPATTSADYQRLMIRLLDETNPRKQLRELLQTLLLPSLAAQYQDSLSALASADVAICHWMQLAGMLAAETGGIPRITVSLNPMALLVSQDMAGLEEGARRLGQKLNDAIWGTEFHQLRAQLGLPVINSIADYQYAQGLNLLAYSPALLAQEQYQHVHAQQCITGFWQTDALDVHGNETRDNETADEMRLQAFLAAGPAPVVFTFGSMGGRAEELLRCLLETVALLNCRAIIQGGWAGLTRALADEKTSHYSSENLLFLDYLDHGRLFPQAACIVHHGGAGTTAAALRAGCPSVIVWHMLDQPYWGNLLFERGLGPRPLARHGLQTTELAASLGEALKLTQNQSDYRFKCQQMAKQLAQENGLAVAQTAIEDICNKKSSQTAN